MRHLLVGEWASGSRGRRGCIQGQGAMEGVHGMGCGPEDTRRGRAPCGQGGTRGRGATEGI